MPNELEENVAIINVSNIANTNELHTILKNSLKFPIFYGMNWNAFWDAITGLVELPELIIFENWNGLENTLPEDAKMIKNMFDEMKEMYPTFRCEIKYN